MKVTPENRNKKKEFVITKEIWKNFNSSLNINKHPYPWFSLAMAKGQAWTSKDPEFWGFIKRVKPDGGERFDSVRWGQLIVKNKDHQLEVYDV